ncbi:MAG: hypothetical protein HY686_01350 [Chloroflexi bacterium]|nr:hypothetical protein [Chloroflexota bacterium]
MMEPRVPYEDLRRQLRRELIRSALLRGDMGPLAFLWSAGEGLFLAVLRSTDLALLWSALAALFGMLMVAGYIQDRAKQESAWRRVAEVRFPVRPISALSAQEAVQQGTVLFVGIAQKVGAIEKRSGVSSDLRRALENAFGLLALHYIEAKQGAGSAVAGEVLQELDTMTRLLDAIHDSGAAVDPALGVQLARETEETLLRLWERQNTTEFEKLQRDLQIGFSQLSLQAGLKALGLLVEAYRLLQDVLEQKTGTEPLVVGMVPGLAEETMGEGLNILRRALGLAQSVHASRPSQMEQEIGELQGAIAELKTQGQQAELLEIRERQLASLEGKLRKIQQQQLGLERLLLACGDCELSLFDARIDLAALQANVSEATIGAVTERLRRAIGQARELQEELRRLGL